MRHPRVSHVWAVREPCVGGGLTLARPCVGDALETIRHVGEATETNQGGSDAGCDGGNLVDAWQYIGMSGAVTGAQQKGALDDSRSNEITN